MVRYLQGTKHFGLLHQSDPASTLNGYSDPGFKTSDYGRSISGSFFDFGKCLVSLSSKKQSVIAQSTAEAELVDLAHASSELLWLKKLVSDMIFSLSVDITVFADNQAANTFSKNEGSDHRSRHVNLKYLVIQDMLEAGESTSRQCRTN